KNKTKDRLKLKEKKINGTGEISSLAAFLNVPRPPPPPLHRGGSRRCPRPTAGPRSLDGLRRPRSLRYSPHRHWRGPPLGAASRHPPFPLSLPRGERPSTCPPSPPNQGFIFATNGVNCISDWSPQVCYRCLKRKAGKGDDSRGDCYFCSDACREHAE
uniref:FLZ-type domain-containing protein n=1 Tax=Aegilops tauschii subsp. strangulata TaxID=200361 RepID=A0A453SJZ9_AEGTS